LPFLLDSAGLASVTEAPQEDKEEDLDNLLQNLLARDADLTGSLDTAPEAAAGTASEDTGDMSMTFNFGKILGGTSVADANAEAEDEASEDDAHVAQQAASSKSQPKRARFSLGTEALANFLLDDADTGREVCDLCIWCC
jgi:hypothetical protein